MCKTNRGRIAWHEQIGLALHGPAVRNPRGLEGLPGGSGRRATAPDHPGRSRSRARRAGGCAAIRRRGGRVSCRIPIGRRFGRPPPRRPRRCLQADWPPGTTVLELGCGVGLVGWRRSSAVATSRSPITRRRRLRIALENARQNGFPQAQSLLIDWHDPPQRIVRRDPGFGRAVQPRESRTDLCARSSG